MIPKEFLLPKLAGILLRPRSHGNKLDIFTKLARSWISLTAFPIHLNKTKLLVLELSDGWISSTLCMNQANCTRPSTDKMSHSTSFVSKKQPGVQLSHADSASGCWKIEMMFSHLLPNLYSHMLQALCLGHWHLYPLTLLVLVLASGL